VLNGTGGAAGGSAFTPGRKNVAGETVPPTLTPEQPAPKASNKASIASRSKLTFNLTCQV